MNTQKTYKQSQDTVKCCSHICHSKTWSYAYEDMHLKAKKTLFSRKRLVKSEDRINSAKKITEEESNAHHNWYVYGNLLKLNSFLIKNQDKALERPTMTMVMKYSGTGNFHKPTPKKIQYYTILVMFYLDITCLKSLMC